MTRAKISLFFATILLVSSFFVVIGCDENNQVVFAEMKVGSEGDILLWLTVEDQYTMGFPLKMVHLVYNSGSNILFPQATIRFNQTINAYQVDIEMPTFQDLQYWELAFHKNEPTILYPKS